MSKKFDENKWRILAMNKPEVKQHIAALESQLPRWISVEERLPDLNEVVLTIYQTREGFGAITLRSRFDDDYWYCGEVGGLVPNRNITHWMPLPPPPEDE